MVEVAASVIVLLIAITGTIAFNHYSMIDIYKAQARTDAVMFGSVIMESWQGQGGTTSFNLINNLSAAVVNCSDIDIRYSVIGPSVPSGFTTVSNLTAYYRITTNYTTYRVVLSYKVIDGKKFLNTRVAWQNNRQTAFYESHSFVGITESIN